MEIKSSIKKYNKYNFKKITAKDERFIKVKNRYTNLLLDFKSFLELKSSSGMPGSYRNSLVCLFVIISELKNIEMYSIEFLNELKLIQNDPNFKKYNKDEGGFPNATIESYFKFWDIKIIDDPVLSSLNHTIQITNENSSTEINPYNLEEINRESKEQQTVQRAKPKSKDEIEKSNNRTPKASNNSTSSAYSTDPSLKKSVIHNIGYQCEYGQMKQQVHVTFMNIHGVQYMEGHHIIPMSAQTDMLPLNIDRTENIMSLCPTCHRAVHNADLNVRKEMIKTILESRQHKLRDSGITVSLESLLKFYIPT